MLESLLADIRFAIRSVARDRGFALVAAITIACGVGATTAVLSVVNAVLLRPLRVPEPDRVVALVENRDGSVSSGLEGTKLPFTRYEAYREGTRDVFEAFAAHRFVQIALRLPDRTVSATGVQATQNYFDVIGATPAIGRFFSGADRDVVLSHQVWRERFGEDVGVLGQSVSLDGEPYTVVGIAPASFTGTTVFRGTDFWVPIDEGAARSGEEGPVGLMGRLRPDVSLEAASTLVNTVALRVPPDEAHSRVFDAHVEVVTGMPSTTREPLRSASALFIGLALLVLLIASANLSGMLLTRAFARRRELAVRLSIGAGRGRVVRHLLSESLLLFLLGAAGGVALGWLGTRAVNAMPFPLNPPPMVDLSPDPAVLAAALGITLGIGLLFGLAPALHASRTDLVSALKEGSVQGGARSGHGRAFFVAAQVAMSVLLLLVAALFVRSLREGLTLDPGFQPEGIVTGLVDLDPHGYDEVRGRIFHQELLDRLRATPGVESAALGSFVFLSGDIAMSDVRTPEPAPGAAEIVNAVFDWAGPGLIETLGIQLVEGRGITPADVDGAPPVIVVNETLARALWPGQTAVGKRLRGAGGEREVVGVIRDGRFTNMGAAPRPFVLIPLAQTYRGTVAVHVRAPGAEAAALQALEEAVRALDPDVAVSEPNRLAAMVDFSLFPHRFASRVVGVFGLIGLALSAIGLYGVLAFNVAHRTREFAVRRALGARRNDVIGQVLKRGGVVIAIGCLAGMALGAGVATLLRSFLIEIRPLDPVSFLAVPLVLLVVAVLASLRPAQRALAVEPTEALRQD
jgi:predicted permease